MKFVDKTLSSNNFTRSRSSILDATITAIRRNSNEEYSATRMAYCNQLDYGDDHRTKHAVMKSIGDLFVRTSADKPAEASGQGMKNGLIRVRAAEDENDFQVELFIQQADEWVPTASEWGILPLNFDEYLDLDLLGDDVVKMITTHVTTEQDSPRFRAIGCFLHGLIFSGKIGHKWQEAAREGLRTYLLVEHPELRQLPWELMHHNDDLSLVESCPIMRVNKFPDDDWGDVEDLPLPIRVLVVVGQEDDRIGTPDEVRAIKRGLAAARGTFEARYLVAPTWAELSAAYQATRPNILHFVGHTTTDGEPELQLCPAGSTTKDNGIRASDIRTLRPAPRIAVLNACRSGHSPDYRSLADAFLADSSHGPGAFAVIGMQGDVRGHAAAVFGGTLYHHLANRVPLDLAATRARAKVYTEADGRNGARDWFLPTVTVRRPVEQVLTAPPRISDAEMADLNGKIGSVIKQFVNRDDERLLVTDGIIPNTGHEPAKVLVLQGESRTGKTMLARWTRRWCALRGHRTKYVDLNEKSTPGFLAVLKAIVDTPDDAPSIAPLADDVLEDFRRQAKDFEEGKVPQPVENGYQTELPTGAMTRWRNGPPENLERVFEAFVHALHRATAVDPLVIILDHVEKVAQGDFVNFLRPMLIDKAFCGRLPNVRLMIILDTTKTAGHWPRSERSDHAQWIDVDMFDPDDFPPLAEDAVHKLGLPFDTGARTLIDGYRRGVIRDGRWTPEMLSTFIGLAFTGARRTS